MSAYPLAPKSGFTERVTELIARAQCRRAESAEDLEAIYGLRYLAYIREGAIKQNSSRRFLDDYDSMPNLWTFGIHIDDRLASSIRIHVSAPAHPDIPAAHVFPDILNRYIAEGKVIIDPTRFVVDFASARQYPELPFITTRLVIMASEYFNADFVLATVRAEHQAFYKRVFGGKVVCPPRPYPSLDKPISMMMSPRSSVVEHVNRRYPFFHSTAAERRALFARASKISHRPAA